ncbi:hypothetical protein [Baaleninema sp.]|uniref:hypothetical protein n=1 Tax=Baaleninema sp. TaxID=3101197 RepID=UPI003D087AB7
MQNRGFQWQLTRFLGLFVPFAGLSGIAAIVFARLYWGYFFQPPRVPSQVREFEKIESITPVSSLETANGRSVFQVDPAILCDRSYQEPLGNSGYCGSSKCNSEYCDPTRGLVELFDRGTLTSIEPQMSLAKLAKLYDSIESTNALYSPESEVYEEQAKVLQGIAIEATAKNGREFVLVSLTGGQFSNDRYPYYDFLFLRQSDNSLQLVDTNKFVYEIAGLEGILEWHTMWSVFLVVGSILTVVFVGILDLASRSSQARKPLS